MDFKILEKSLVGFIGHVKSKVNHTDFYLYVRQNGNRLALVVENETRQKMLVVTFNSEKEKCLIIAVMLELIEQETTFKQCGTVEKLQLITY